MDAANNKHLLVLPEVRRRLRENDSPVLSIPRESRGAGVALILKSRLEQQNVLFIQRASRDADPWSGHIAFPGGHHDQSDSDLLHTVIRETKEEVGITLSPADCVSQLHAEKPYTSDQQTDLLVLPFVFVLTYEPDLDLNHEVAEAIWVPLEVLISGKLLTYETVHFKGHEYRLPGFRLNDKHFVWGLTFRVLQRFLSIVAQT